ncbi:hypothetical protein [Novosphingobium sp. 9]|uniref:hypothetical protein n=1 Tax=Novosphingobium sp. 9 TaxID=2025349 RepID=UPI0021B579C7|nr:hypothetical protein [Novosphingobium sp. 9]
MRLPAVLFFTCSTLIALPAQAQIVGPLPDGSTVDRTVYAQTQSEAVDYGQDRLRTRAVIDEARSSGHLSHHESKALRRQAGYIDALADRFGADGYSPSKLKELDFRERALEGLAGAAKSRNAKH